MPLMEEEVVVEKRPVVKEELVIGRRVVEERDTVEAEVRREKFDIDNSADVESRDQSTARNRRSYQLGFGGFVAHPDVGPSWKLRGAIVILLPRRR